MRCSEAAGELAADTGGELDGVALRLRPEAVEAAEDDLLDRVGHPDVLDRAGQRVACRRRGGARPSLGSDFVTSSMKKGLPSALPVISRAEVGAAATATCRTAPASAALSSGGSCLQRQAA